MRHRVERQPSLRACGAVPKLFSRPAVRVFVNGQDEQNNQKPGCKPDQELQKIAAPHCIQNPHRLILSVICNFKFRFFAAMRPFTNSSFTAICINKFIITDLRLNYKQKPFSGIEKRPDTLFGCTIFPSFKKRLAFPSGF